MVKLKESKNRFMSVGINRGQILILTKNRLILTIKRIGRKTKPEYGFFVAI